MPAPSHAAILRRGALLNADRSGSGRTGDLNPADAVTTKPADLVLTPVTGATPCGPSQHLYVASLFAHHRFSDLMGTSLHILA